MLGISMLYALMLFGFLLGMLTHSSLTNAYCLQTLQVWYAGVIPALLPFMILSGILIRTGLAEKLADLFFPILGAPFRASKIAGYIVFMGFLCGFPMGARTIAECLERGLITKKEGRWLLAFCNNLSPAYCLGMASPLLNLNRPFTLLFLCFGIPLFYGFLLRRTIYREVDLTEQPAQSERKILSISEAITASVQSAMDGILVVGGTMVFFGLLNLIPQILFHKPFPILGPLFEITTGLKNLGGKYPAYSLAAICFGGTSCIAQTAACLRNVDLKDYVFEYVIHKLIQSTITFFCYFLLF